MEGRGKHTVRLHGRGREGEREQRTHGRVEEEKPIGGSSKAGDKKKIYLSSFFLPFSLSLSERPLWDQVVAVHSKLNFTWPLLLPLQAFDSLHFLTTAFFSEVEEVVVVVSHPREKER